MCSGLPHAHGCAGLGAGLLWSHCCAAKTLWLQGVCPEAFSTFFFLIYLFIFLKLCHKWVNERSFTKHFETQDTFSFLLKFWWKQYPCHFSWAAPPKYLSWFRQQWNLGDFSDAGKSVSCMPCAGEVSNVALESKVLVFRIKKTPVFQVLNILLKAKTNSYMYIL